MVGEVRTVYGYTRVVCVVTICVRITISAKEVISLSSFCLTSMTFIPNIFTTLKIDSECHDCETAKLFILFRFRTLNLRRCVLPSDPSFVFF